MNTEEKQKKIETIDPYERSEVKPGSTKILYGILIAAVLLYIFSEMGNIFPGMQRKKPEKGTGDMLDKIQAVQNRTYVRPVTAKKPRQSDKIGAFVMSQQFLKDRLKAPSTAKFPLYDAACVTDLGDGRYKVTSYVDAQNSFGAMLRTRYVCVLRKSTDGDQWNLELINTQ
jgi:hypothetical protein